ncbi:MAG: sigma-70 family RNA polymerase sigma factor [Actinomycetota bacterium]
MSDEDTEKRDPAAVSFDVFYSSEHNRLVALAVALCGSSTVAEDVVQDAFVAAFDQWERIDHPDAWIRAVVANRASSLFRRRALEARKLLLGVAPDASAEPELYRQVDELWSEVRKLPKRQAQAVALRYVDGASLAEIAGILGVSENTVKTHLQRAKRALAVHREVQP